MEEIIYKELSFKLVGLAYDISNALGFGFDEKTYAKAYEELLTQSGINHSREHYCQIKINDKTIARNYFDFLVEEKIVVELKVGDKNYYAACTQLFRYLKVSNLKLGLIFRFTKDGVKVKRIVNIR